MSASTIHLLEVAIARLSGNCDCVCSEIEHVPECDKSLHEALGIAQDEVCRALELARHEMIMASELVALREKLEALERRADGCDRVDEAHQDELAKLNACVAAKGGAP